jgi:hypothetical protein
MTDRPLASDLSAQVLQRRDRLRELATPRLNEANRRRQLAGLLPGNTGTVVHNSAPASEEERLRHAE